jgi:uncharacterized membrane protein YhiD involved in acid resistance
MVQEIIDAAIGTLFATITGIITVVILPQLANWLKAKTENQKLQHMIDELTQTAQTSVDHIEQTLVKQYKADGKWDSEAQKDALKAAVNESIQSLTSTTVKSMNDNDIVISEIVTRYVESYIQSKSKGGNSK